MLDQKYFKELLNKEEYNRLVEMDTFDQLLDFMKQHHAYTAIIDGENHYTYETLLRDVYQTQNALLTLGLKPSDHVGLLFGNDYQFVRLYLACVSLGMVAVVLSPSFLTYNFEYFIKKTDVKTIISDDQYINALINLNLNVKIYPQSQVTSSNTQAVKHQLTKDLKSTIVFTSGTTASPRAVLLSQRNMLVGTLNGAYMKGRTFHLNYYAIIPFTHIFGLIRSLLTALYTGSTVTMCKDMRNILTDLTNSNPDILILVPGLVEALYGLFKMKGKENVAPRLAYIICGGAPLSEKFIERYHQLGISIFPGYGLTETANLVSGNGYSLSKPQSVGQPYLNQTLKIVDQELWIKGDNVMIEYYNDPELTQDTLVDGWFKTGDLVELDQDGDLRIVGRSKNIILLKNGVNISPEELELKVNALPYIKDALVYQSVDGNLEFITCEVFTDPMMVMNLGISDVQMRVKQDIALINQQLPSFMQMTKIIVRSNDFKRSASMKVLRNQTS